VQLFCCQMDVAFCHQSHLLRLPFVHSRIHGPWVPDLRGLWHFRLWHIQRGTRKLEILSIKAVGILVKFIFPVFDSVFNFSSLARHSMPSVGRDDPIFPENSGGHSAFADGRRVRFGCNTWKPGRATETGWADNDICRARSDVWVLRREQR
jgi:hypothetical protein